jgi:alpha-L-rhamnosidase
MSKLNRQLLDPNACMAELFAEDQMGQSGPLFDRGCWPANWIHAPQCPGQSHFQLYRLAFNVDQDTKLDFSVTADERYTLYFDQQRLADGPQRGDLDNWFFDSYTLDIPKGKHVIEVLVYALGEIAHRSQISLRPGLLFCPHEPSQRDLFASGSAKWEVAVLDGFSFEIPFENEAFSIPYNVVHQGPWIDSPPADEQWKSPEVGLPGADPAYRNRCVTTHLLRPATIPSRRREQIKGLQAKAIQTTPPEPSPYRVKDSDPDILKRWQDFLDGTQVITIPPNQSYRVLIDTGNYHCLDFQAALSDGADASVQVHLAESLFIDNTFVHKGKRDEIEGKLFRGIGETLISNGQPRQRFNGAYWHSGRFIEITVTTKDQALTISELNFIDTGYPIDQSWAYQATPDCFEGLFPMAVRTLQGSSHDSSQDGPHYEQMLWAGDNVQTTLCHYVIHRDALLLRSGIEMFRSSQMNNGLTRARWPARDTMIIAPYSLHWINAIYLYAMWRGDLAYVRTLLPAMRRVIDAFLAMRNADGLVELHGGWNYVDWVPEWDMGIAPGADGGVNAYVNWHFVWTLGQLAELEEHFGEPELSARMRRLADSLSETICAHLWNADRGLFQDCPDEKVFSEQSQVFAVLANTLSDEFKQGIQIGRTDSIITPATISFSHFVFDACFKLNRADVFFDRLPMWHGFIKNGFSTFPEGPEPSRSDCHGWSSHPMYHYFASVLGIQPASFGFDQVRIQPQLGPLTQACGTIPHPKGEIRVEYQALTKDEFATKICLPEGVTGEIHHGKQVITLASGEVELRYSM